MLWNYYCHLASALASGLARPRWRELDPPPARNGSRCPHHQSDSRQTRTLSGRFGVNHHLRLSKLACLLVRLDHVASRVLNTN